MIRFCLPLAVLTFAAAGLRAQAPPAPQPPAPGTGAAAQSSQPYSYNPENRRDPFLSLLGRGNDPRQAGSRPPGVAGLLIAEVAVKGVLRDRSGFVAMIVAPDDKTYIVKQGDKLFDGTVKAIAPDKVIFSQDVNDPLSLVRQREVPKAVRPADGRGAPPQP